MTFRGTRLVTLVTALALTGSTVAAAAPHPTPAPSSFTSTDSGDGHYSVPLFNSDVPDVSVERLPAAENDEGRDIYYMISTTMHLSPGAPIMKSYDLVNWETVNYVFDRIDISDSSSLRNGKSSYGQGQWASSLRYHDGKFYVVFNTNNLGGAFLYSTNDIEDGTWTRTALGRGLHDPSLFFDDQDGGTPYIFYGVGTTNAVQLDASMTRIVAEYPGVFRKADFPDERYVTSAYEGMQTYFIDGYYYMVAISWPPGEGRQVIMFRSKELLGRHTSAGGVNTYEAKSALNSDGFAQGGLVPVSQSDGSTAWYGMFFRDTFPTGRMPGLIPSTWSEGWPVFGNNGVVKFGDTFAKPITLSPAEEALERQKSVVTSDDFDNDAPHKAYMDEAHELPASSNLDTTLLGVQLLQNEGFESAQLDPWRVQYSANLAVGASSAASGASGLRVSARANNGSGPGQVLDGKVQAGVTYTTSAKVRYTEGPDKMTFIIGASSNQRITTLATGVAVKGQWTTITGDYAIPVGADTRSFTLVIETPWAPNQTPADQVSYDVDDLSFIGKPVTSEEPTAAEITPNGSQLDLAWEWNHNPDNRYWSLTDRDGWLRLTNGKVLTGEYKYAKLSGRDDMTYFEEARNTLSQRTFAPTSSAETKLDISGMKDGDVAGIASYTRSFSYAAVKRVDGRNTLGVVEHKQPFSASIDQAAVEAFVPGSTVDIGSATEVFLKADADFKVASQLWMTYSYSLDGLNWHPLGARTGSYTMDWTLSHFMGFRFGLFNYATESVGGHVDFDYYNLSNVTTADGAALTTAALDAAIAQAGGLTASAYPAQEWSTLQTVLTKAKTARAGELGTQNQIDAPQRALSFQLAKLAVVGEASAPSLDVSVVAGTRCVAGKGLVTVQATNNESVPMDITLTTTYGTKTFTAVASGKNAFHAFTTRLVTVPDGTTTTTATAIIDGGPVTLTTTADYAVHACG